MRNKKIIIISILVAILIIALGVTYYIFNREDENTTLNLIEKQWIDNNKNKVIDISIMNNVPVFSYNGEGLMFDFVTAIQEVTGLDFNKIPYQLGTETNSSYVFTIKENLEKNDILIYEDSYVLLSNYPIVYNQLSDIKNLSIGVLSDNLENVNKYLKSATNVSFKTFDNPNDLIMSTKAEDETKVDAIVLPKVRFLESTVKEENLNISYHINEMKQYYVLSLGGESRLNNIIKKYYSKWASENFSKSFSNHLTNNYFTFKNFDEHDIVKFRSKRYIYGFVNNEPYDFIRNNRLDGINSTILREVSNLSNIEISYEEFSNYDDLVKNFNENKIDFYFDINGDQAYSLDVVKMSYAYNDNNYIISNIHNNMVINSINSIGDNEVFVLENSIASKYLKQNNIKVKEFKTINNLIKNIKNDSIYVLDENTYKYYSLNNQKIDFTFRVNDSYEFVSRDINDNKIFNDYLGFYLTFVSTKDIINKTIPNLIVEKNNSGIFFMILVYLMAVVGVYYITNLLITVVKKKFVKRKTLTKTDKLKYIDLLTSLKNRNYFNDHVKVWDESEVYPQAIVIIDLNNIAYINDNYGHEEGDKVIVEAANILIQNQKDNSEIMRTDGNEFLIYMVGYDEKEIVSYTKKLNKELKEIAHNFGAAIGYSMINDPIKTIDDAVNEATIAMRENKEEFL